MPGISSSSTGSAAINGGTPGGGGSSDVTSANGSLSVGQNCAPLNTSVGNTFVGFSVASRSLRGGANTAFGSSIAPSLAGDSNVYVGVAAAPAATYAAGNVVVGAAAAAALALGTNNVVVGASAAPAGPAGGGDPTAAVAVGAGAVASSSATSVGASASARGAASVALGAGAVADGTGHFSLAGRVEGYFSSAGAQGAAAGSAYFAYDTYAVQVNADVLKVANGGALAFCPRGGGGSNVSSLASSATNATPAWTLQLASPRPSAARTSGALDLALQSSSGASVRFVDDFVPGLLDFTAQHRCRASPPLRPPIPEAATGAEDAQTQTGAEADSDASGLLVVATGRYAGACSLGACSLGAAPTVDEAVPVVALARRAYDPRVFGVVSALPASAAPGVGGGGGGRATTAFRLGNLAFDVPDTRSGVVVVNAAGEGGMWVSDENGPIANGDLLVSSAELPGYAMRQGGPGAAPAGVVCACTAAKATCDCPFSPSDALAARVLRGTLTGRILHARLVGVTYRF
jgi:hypothetical protein